MQDGVLLEMTGISKSFPGVKALDGVNFKLRAGEVHALMGENGAGKSTLIKILTGIYGKDSGVIRLDGQEINPESSLEAQHHGISSIYQELNLVPSLSIAENIFIGREPRKYGLIDWRTIRKRSRQLLKEVGLKEELDVTTPLSKHSTSIQQMVAIARAISIDTKIIIMDESTSSLNEKEVQNLFQVVRNLKSQGIAVVFVSHRLDEIFEICDRVTVLKDGQLVDEYPTEGLTKLALVSAMIGRDATSIMDSHKQYSDELAQSRKYVAEAEHLQHGMKVADVTLKIKEGEVLGLAGLLGSGRTETAQLLFGDTVPEGGHIKFKGEKKDFERPGDAIREGIGFCPEDRKVNGIMPHMSVLDNMTIVLLPALAKRGIISTKEQRRIAAEYVQRLGVKTADLNTPIRNLSGGNQQKVLLARWLCTHPSLMILDEPTRGIDVGAKSEIEAVVQDLASKGIGILMISSELEELTRGCDRIAIMRDGKTIAEIEGNDISEHRITEAIAHED